jgi:hypothetical protein
VRRRQEVSSAWRATLRWRATTRVAVVIDYGQGDWATLCHAVLTKGHHAKILGSARGSDSGRDIVVYHTTGSGKTTSMIMYFMQAMHQTKGFSVSSRALTRAGVDTELLRSLSSADRRPVANPIDDECSGTAAEQGGSPATHLGDACQPQSHHSAAAHLGLVVHTLAMAAASIGGALTAPVPTEPPGRIVRAHPRVPRGPSPARTVFRPSGGVLSGL